MASEPYVSKQPGDIIRAGDWNEMQSKARDEIRSHTHTGDANGMRIPRGGIEPKAIDGSLIDPAAKVTVKSLTTGDLTINGKAILGDIADLAASVKGLGNDKLNRAGDTMSGSLTITNSLTVTETITGKKDLTLTSGNANISGVVNFGAQVRQMLNLWNTDYGIGIQSGTQYFRTSKNFAWYKGGTHKDGELDAGGGSAQMVIQDGKVGIGTPKPAYDFDVKAKSIKLGLEEYGGGMLILACNANDNKIYLEAFSSTGQDSAAELLLTGRHATAVPSLRLVANATRISGGLTIDNGTSGLRLTDNTVNGHYFDIRFENKNQTVVFYHQNGHGQYMRQDGKWALNSDQILKENILELQGVLNEVLKLRPVKFQWKSSQIDDIGFIAQEVEEIFPEFVSTTLSPLDEKRELKGLPYTNFGVLAIAAIKEMKKLYDERLNELENKISALKK